MRRPLLSILTPAIWGRVDQSQALHDGIQSQAAALPDFRMEHLVLLDDRKMTIGEKRQKLLESARGDYVAFVDDDDGVSDDYISSLAGAIAHGADVVTFVQRAVINGVVGHVDFRVTHKADEPWRHGETAKRRPWHVCAWKRELVRDCRFLFCNYGEDAAWVAQACGRVKTGVHVPRVLHIYSHSAATTAAPMPG
jgi:glycosyltransferase involved in cell wall biosynthesis